MVQEGKKSHGTRTFFDWDPTLTKDVTGGLTFTPHVKASRETVVALSNKSKHINENNRWILRQVRRSRTVPAKLKMRDAVWRCDGRGYMVAPAHLFERWKCLEIVKRACCRRSGQPGVMRWCYLKRADPKRRPVYVNWQHRASRTGRRFYLYYQGGTKMISAMFCTSCRQI